MGSIKKLVLYGFAVLLPATTLMAAPGNLRSVDVRGVDAYVSEIVSYPDYLENVFTLAKVTSFSINHKDLVESVKLLIHTLDFAHNNQKDVIGKLAFIEQSICKTSSLEVIRNFNDLAQKIGYQSLTHVVYWNALYQARLKGQVVPQDIALETLDASNLNLSAIDFRALCSIFPNLKKINLSNNQITHIDDAQLPYLRGLEINVRGNPLSKVSYGFFNAGCTIELDETAPVYTSTKFSALWAAVRIVKDASRYPKLLAQSLLVPLALRDGVPSLVGSGISLIAPDFARNGLEQALHDFVYRSAVNAVLPRKLPFSLPSWSHYSLLRPWFYYSLHDAASSLLGRYNLGTSAVGKILYPVGFTVLCDWLNRYSTAIPGVDEITQAWSMAHDAVVRNISFKAQVIGAVGLVTLAGIGDYIHRRTAPTTIKAYRV